MAKFHPSQLRRRPKPTYGERMVFARLHDLDDGWLVLSSLHFLWEDRGRTRPGESDFVLLHPTHGMLIIEVKDASYRLNARTWYRIQNGQEHKDQSPFEQAANNRWKIARHLNKHGVDFVPIGHCVLFTHGRPSGDLGPDAPDGIVLTLASLDPVRDAVMSVIHHWGKVTWKRRDAFERAVQVLSPEVLVAPTLDYEVDVSVGEIHRLTDEQVTLSTKQLEAVRMTSTSPRSLILGGAGTGKTLVAFRYARKVASDGRQVAVFGAPRELRLLTRRQLNAQGVHSGDLVDILGSVYPEASLAAEVGQATWEVLLSLAEEHGARLDTIVVDEAQSVDPDVLSALLYLVKAHGQVVLCADPFQLDASGTWKPPGEYSTFWLTDNCRNTLPISKVVARVAGAQTPTSGAPGRAPVLVHGEGDLFAQAVAALREDLTAMAPSDMVVLTRSPPGAKKMHEALQRAGVKSRRKLQNGHLAVLTVDEFRGCEAKSVLYLAESVDESDTRTLDYVAVSRACAHLRVVSEPELWNDIAFLFDLGGTA